MGEQIDHRERCCQKRAVEAAWHLYIKCHEPQGIFTLVATRTHSRGRRVICSITIEHCPWCGVRLVAPAVDGGADARPRPAR